MLYLSFQKYHARTFQSGTHLHQLPQDSAPPLTEVSSKSKNPSLPLRVKRVPEEDDATVTPQKSNTDVVPAAVTTFAVFYIFLVSHTPTLPLCPWRVSPSLFLLLSRSANEVRIRIRPVHCTTKKITMSCL